MSNFPVVVVGGDAYAAGVGYGSQARTRIATSILNYAATFAWCGLDWDETKRAAQPFRTIIGDFRGELIDEMQGIADGAGLSTDDILALNCRTELLPESFGQPLRRTARRKRGEALARNAARGLDHPGICIAASLRSPDDAMVNECTAIAVSSDVSDDGATWLAQNWDWMGWQREAMVVLKTAQFTTLTEAGMLAKIGVNTHGLAVGLNILRSTDDGAAGRTGMPVHATLRLLLEKCDSVPSAQMLLNTFSFVSSSNIIVADAQGHVASFELSPRGCALVPPQAGIVVHTNHFLHYSGQPFEGNLGASISSEPRWQCMRRFIEKWQNEKLAPGLLALKTALSYQADNPRSLARKPDLSIAEELRVETVASIAIDCKHRTLHIAPKVPTVDGYVQIVH